MSDKDRLFETPADTAQDFVFDERVVRVFPDMINRSVPGYGLVVPMAGLLARRYAQDNTVLYDLGCSLGAVALAMSQAVRAGNTRIVAVDNSPAMIARLHDTLGATTATGTIPIDPVCEDVRDTVVENASVVLHKIAAGLLPGGILLLSEKICFEEPREQSLQTQWHHDFKRAQGYSELEISGKRDALEHVMQTESLPRHRERLLQAGFSEVYTWFQAFNFISVIARR